MSRGSSSSQTVDTAPTRRNDAIADTLKTDKPIFRMLTLDAQNNPIGQVINLYDRGDLDIDPPYQRGQVWGQARKINLVRSLVMGLPIGSMFINRRSWIEPEVMVDGKQRMMAVREFFNDGFQVPSSWFRPEHVEGKGEMIFFSELSDPGQLGLKNSSMLNVYHTNFEGETAEEQEKALFDLINFGGVPQGESDLTE